MAPLGKERHGRREVTLRDYAHCISVSNELARGRPNNAEPVRRKPSDMLAGSDNPGEGLSAPSKLGPDTFMTVNFGSLTWRHTWIDGTGKPPQTPSP